MADRGEDGMADRGEDGQGRGRLGRRRFLGLGAAALGAATLGVGACDDSGDSGGPSDASAAGDGGDTRDASDAPDVSGRGDPLELPGDPPPAAPPLPDGVFGLGVASGDPLHDRVILWTRLAPDPLGGGGMPAEDVPVIWEVFADEDLREPVRNGWTWARPATGHAVHVDVDRLEAGRFYWYRFRVGDSEASPVGRTRTFPAPGSSPERMRLAFACCQKYRDGYYTAHDHLAATLLDAVVFLGDYIYESGGDSDVPGRAPVDRERVTDLEGFRARYGAYRMDPALQASHAAHPWIVTWDDHEVSNDYAGLWFEEDRRGDGDPLEIRRAAYQAWYEHMPVRVAPPEDPAHMRIYRRFSFGDLAELVVLDTRQYRDPPPCEEKVGAPCDELLAGGRTILGDEQMAWLDDALRGSDARWNVVAQSVLVSPVLFELGLANRDQWDGYPDDRQRVLDLLAEPSVQSPMVISGDVHAAAFGELYRDQYDPASERVALEVLTTSISSGGDGADTEAAAAGLAADLSDSVHYAEGTRRGFAVCEYDRDGCEVTFHAVTTVLEPEADLVADARFRVQAGSLDFERLD